MKAELTAEGTVHAGWRRDFCFLLRLFSQWLKDNSLLDDATQDRIKRLSQGAQSKQLTTVFVAGSSSSISGWVNALFFAKPEQRITLASVGHGAMCTTEIGHAPDCEPSLRLLPIHTRLQTRSIAEWRKEPEAWTSHVLDIRDTDQIASTMERAAETVQVTLQEAHALGLFREETPQEQETEEAQRLVEIPKWSYAQINIEHPLLDQGLVVLMTPGLSDGGARCEHAIGILDQAQVCVLTLNANTGVSESDMAIWQDHIAPRLGKSITALVVLDMIGTQWDDLGDSAKTASKFEMQKKRTAEMLEIDEKCIIGVASHSAIFAKKSDQARLPEKNRRAQLQVALVPMVLEAQQRRVYEDLKAGLAAIKMHLDAVLEVRQRKSEAKQTELKTMRVKSQQVLAEMRQRLSTEQHQLEQARPKIAAFQWASRTMFQTLSEQLRPEHLGREMTSLAESLARLGLTWQVRHLYNDTFDRLQNQAKAIHATVSELSTLQAQAITQINANNGFKLPAFGAADIAAYQIELELIRDSQMASAGFRYAFRLKRADFVREVVRALSRRLEQLQAAVRADVQKWRMSLVAQLKAHSALKREYLASQHESILRIEHAADGFDQHLKRLADSQLLTQTLCQKLDEHAADLNAAIAEVPEPLVP